MNAKPLPLSSLSSAFRAFIKHPSPWLLFALLTTAIVARAAIGVAPNFLDLAIVTGVILFWPIQEWLIHVVILHWKPIKLGPLTLDMHVAREHRAHHSDPWRIDKIYMPFRTLVLTVLFLIVPLVALLSLVSINAAVTFVLAYAVFATAYEWSHFLMHTAYKPRTRAFARLQKNHRLHHFKNEHYWYGVVTTQGDRVFGTLVGPQDVDRSGSAKQLG